MKTGTVRRLGGVGVALVVSVLLLAGCSGGGQPAGGEESAGSSTPGASATSGGGIAALSATTILRHALHVTKAATSVRVKGKGRDHGDTVALDLRLAGKRRATGHIWLNHQRIDVIRIRSVLYVSGNARFWRASTGQQDVTQFTGMYLKTSTHNKDFADLLSLLRLSDLLGDVADPTGQVAKKARTTFHGAPAVPIVDAGRGTLYVAATGKPYILGLRGSGQRLNFTDYGRKMAVHAPARDRIIPV